MSRKNILYIFISLTVFLTSSALIYRKIRRTPDKTTEFTRNYLEEGASQKADYPKRRFSFCDEQMPHHQSENYRKFNRQLRHYLAYRNGLKQLFKRADYYLPPIEKRLIRCGLPSDLKYIPMIESRFLVETSSKGASGFWQFMPQTAINYGLTVNEEVDQRQDVKKSTGAACNYLSNLHQQLGTWTLSAAAYNAGIGEVADKLDQNDKKLFPNYYNTKWNKETSDYVFRLLAIKHLYENREQYGL